MAERYRIRATPMLGFQSKGVEGKGAGGLKGVAFTATSGEETREWFARDCGQFAGAFARLMPESVARVLVASLEQGDAVELPGVYEEEQFERGFGYEWSPVHFVVPPQFVQAGTW